MVAVLGIDAAWTAGRDSGFALVSKETGGWHVIAAAPNIRDYARACGFAAAPDVTIEDAYRASCQKLGGMRPDLVATDMPLSRGLIRARRKADDEVSRHFGAAGCGTHTPTPTRPGDVGRRLQHFFESRGHRLATTAADLAFRALVEVYPHPAILRLTKASKRVPYKVSKTKRYWPGDAMELRVKRIQQEMRCIGDHLETVVAGAADVICWPSAPTLAALKSTEDVIDAIVSAWVGIETLEGRAEAFGDDEAAIWIPSRQ